MSGPFSLDGLAKVIDEAETLAGSARAALTYLASCAPVDAGPDEPPQHPLPWSPRNWPMQPGGGREAEQDIVSAPVWLAPGGPVPQFVVAAHGWDRESVRALIVHRVNAFPVALAQLTAALHRAEQAERERDAALADNARFEAKLARANEANDAALRALAETKEPDHG